MFESTSRYARLTVKEYTVVGPDGETHTIRYAERRFVPPAAGETAMAEHVIAEGERLDTIAARYFADAGQFWRIADTNEAARPEELADRIGQPVRIVLPR